jgi:hypothetical protein
MVHTVSKFPAEEALRGQFRQGLPLDLNRPCPRRMHGGKPVHDRKRLIHAPVLRELLLSAGSPSEGCVQQLTVIGADILGPLDLRFAKIDCPIRLENCWFYDPVTLSEAELRSVSLRDSTAERGIDASHVRVTGDLMLDWLRVFGPLVLEGAHLEDDIHLSDASIYQQHLAFGDLAVDAHEDAPNGSGESSNRDRPLLDLESVEVKGRIVADRLYVEGTVGMDGATVGGTLHLDSADLGSVPEMYRDRRVGDAWRADGLRVAGELNAKRLWARGQVTLVDAHMQSLVLTGVHIDYCESKPALVMDRMQCDGSLFCADEISLDGGISAIGINVGASFYLGHGEVRGTQPDHGKTRAVSLQRARISADLRCEAKFRSAGIFDISDARIGGSVNLNGAIMDPAEGESIGFDAGRAQIGGNLRCERSFFCRGIMALMNARIDGVVQVAETSENNTLLLGSGLRAGRFVQLQITGRIDLSGAEIAEGLIIDLATLRAGDDADEPTADLSGLTARVLKLDGRQRGYLDLTRASVRLLIIDPTLWCPGKRVPSWIPRWLASRVPRLRAGLDERSRIAKDSPTVLDGLVYDDITPAGGPETNTCTPERDTRRPDGPRDRLVWLEAGTRVTRRPDIAGSAGAVSEAGGGAHPRYRTCGFVPQPYHQLAAFYRSIGRDCDARDVLYAMYCRHNAAIHKNGHHPILWTWNATQNVALGYGYRPKRAFGWVLLLAALATVYIILRDDQSHLGVVSAAILSLGLALPDSGIDKVQGMVRVSALGHLVALGLVAAGLVLGATVIAAIGRAIRN